MQTVLRIMFGCGIVLLGVFAFIASIGASRAKQKDIE